MAKSRKRVTGVPVSAREETAPSGDTTAASGVRERIAERAYDLYRRRGGEHGRDLDDWLEAERELVRTRRQDDRNPDNVA